MADHPTAQLYPFLVGASAGVGDTASDDIASDDTAGHDMAGDDTKTCTSALLADVQRSTVAKVREIIGLRTEVERAEGAQVADCANVVAESFAAGGRLFAFGNGGSSTDAQALATLFCQPEALPSPAGAQPAGAQPAGAPSLPAFALTADVAVLTALANDIGFDVVFARQLAAAGRPRDVAVGLSTSGNSENLIRAFAAARSAGMVTVGLAGYDGGRMAQCDDIDYLFVVRSPSVHRIQEAQTTVYHLLWELTVTRYAARPQSTRNPTEPETTGRETTARKTTAHETTEQDPTTGRHDD